MSSASPNPGTIQPRPGFHQTNQTARADLLGGLSSPDQILETALGTPYLNYRALWKAAEDFRIVTPWPLHLDIDTNYTCNLSCIMCPLGVEGFPVSYPGKWLDYNLYAKVLREGAAQGLSSIRLGITGEPLFRKDILDFVNLARELGITDIMLITNGLLLKGDLVRNLIEAGLTRLMVSIDAARPETYAQIRRGGDHAQVVENVLGFIHTRQSLGSLLPLLRVSFVKMSLNESELDQFKEFWKSKADYISIQQYSNILGSGRTAYHASDRRRISGFRCPEPWQRMSLFVNGDLFPCCSDLGRLAPLGNATKTTVSRVWTSVAAHRLRLLHQQGQWQDDPTCRRCALSSTGLEC
jgi:radical SAM protein with 4Fe4S-binding SPASM domain